MLNNLNKNSACAESLISYLYGEISAAEKVEFEAHLQSCANCTNELTDFGLARSAIQEWRGVEFDKLATPIFEIPTGFVNTQTVTADASRSWFADWRRVFSFNPALAMSALAILIALFGITFFVYNSSVKNQIAKNTDHQNTVEAVVSPTKTKTVEQTEQIPAADPDKSISPVAVPTDAVEKKSPAVKNPPVRISVNAPKNTSPEIVPVKITQNTNRGNQKPAVLPKSKNPRLTDAEVEEDNSVRLADLFDEIETR